MLFAAALTLLAGLASGLGGMASIIRSPGGRSFLPGSLGFSAGVMIYVSMVELLPQATENLTTTASGRPGAWWAVGSFFAGIALIAVIDRLVPDRINPHEPNLATHTTPRKDALVRTGLITAAAVGLHNFPEGFATFMSALDDPGLGIPIAVAIGIHNIPEGIAVAVPIHEATGSRTKAALAAWASGLAEPLGALIGYALLRPWITDTTLGVVLAGVAGIMVFISFDELLPTAQEYGQHHTATYGLMAGMAVMALSLLLLG